MEARSQLRRLMQVCVLVPEMWAPAAQDGVPLGRTVKAEAAALRGLEVPALEPVRWGETPALAVSPSRLPRAVRAAAVPGGARVLGRRDHAPVLPSRSRRTRLAPRLPLFLHFGRGGAFKTQEVGDGKVIAVVGGFVFS